MEAAAAVPTRLKRGSCASVERALGFDGLVGWWVGWDGLVVVVVVVVRAVVDNERMNGRTF